MNGEEAHDILGKVCQYASLCHSGNYGNRWACQYDKVACSQYHGYVRAELSLLEHLGALETKILILSGDEE